MAEIKKYLGEVGLGALIDQIKAEDAKTLATSKKYTEDSGKLYEPAGSVKTAEENAKAYAEEKVNELANGQVKNNTDAIAALNGTVETEGSVAKAVNDAKTDLQEKIDAVNEKAVKNAGDIAAINNEQTGILKQAKDHADAKAAEVQGNVDNLKTFVGTLPEGATATDVIGYVNEKTANIASDATVTEIADKVTQAEKDIDVLEKDVTDIKSDYLVEADKTELQGNIDAVGAKVDTLVGTDTGKSARTIANEELAKQLIAEGAKESLDTLQEIAAWIQAHPEDAAEMNRAIEALEALVGTLPEGITATTIVGYIAEAVAAEKTRAEAAESELNTKISNLEAKFGDGEGSVADMIADAKQEVTDAAAADAQTKANTAETNAKKHADDLNTAMDSRVKVVEDKSHEHANKAELDLIAVGDKAKWDAAAGKAHEHANAEELNKIALGDKAKWDAAEKNAKDYADSLNTTMGARVDAVSADVAKNAENITAVDGAVDAAVERIAKNEANIAANTSAINSLVAFTKEEVDAYFA